MTEPQPRGNYPTPSSNPVFATILRWNAVLAAAIAVVGGVVGFLTVGWAGVWSALIGAVITLVFLGVTAASILIANRYTASPIYTTLFFVIVLGSWMVKFVLFIVLVLILRAQSWLDPTVLFFCIVAGVVGSLTIDVVVVARSRMPYVSDVRPDRRG